MFYFVLETKKCWLLQRVQLLIWDVEAHEMGVFSIPVHSFHKVFNLVNFIKVNELFRLMIKYIIHELWNFVIFSVAFQDVISDSPSTFECHYDVLTTKINILLTLNLIINRFDASLYTFFKNTGTIWTPLLDYTARLFKIASSRTSFSRVITHFLIIFLDFNLLLKVTPRGIFLLHWRF